MRKLLSPAGKVIITLINVYQATLSPDYGLFRAFYPYGFCRHAPTCSEYAKRAILERGVIVGGMLGMRRLFSCNPWREPSEERLRRCTMPL